jgi:hypothetical protein
VTNRERRGSSAPGRRGRTLRPATLSVLVAFAGTGFPQSPLEGQSVRYSGALQYVTGSYVFDARSHSFSLSSGLTLDVGRFDASLSVPVILRNGGVLTTVGDQLLPTGGDGHGVVAGRRSGDRIRTHGGGGTGPGGGMHQEPDSTVNFRDAYEFRIGDPFLRVSSDIVGDRGRLRSLRATGGVKVPVTDLDSGVGTGEWDYTLGASATVLLGSLFLMGDAGYWWYGDLPDLELRNGVSWGAALAGFAFDRRVSLMATVSGSSRPIRTMDPPLNLGVAAGFRLTGEWSGSAGVSAGLTESAADLALYLGWSRSLRDGF